MGTPQRICPHCHHDQSNRKENPSQCLASGSILMNHYLVGPVLGQGGFGITYRGFELNSGTRVAIKEYFPDGFVMRDSSTGNNQVQVGFSPKTQEFYSKSLIKFKNEALQLAELTKLKLPSIVRAKAYFEANGTAYLIMDYIDGMDMKNYLKWYRNRNPRNPNQNPLDYDMVIGIMKPVIEDMDVVHKKSDLVHRDISPDNLMVNKNGEVRVIDFGAAKMSAKAEDNRSTTILLKKGYAPYEQYLEGGNIGPWTDVYALCATMYRLITGVLPPEAPARRDKDTLVPLHKLKLNKKVPRNVSKVIQKGMAVRFEDRYQSMQELHAALSKVMSGYGEMQTSQRTGQTGAAVDDDVTYRMPSPNQMETMSGNPGPRNPWEQGYNTRQLTYLPTGGWSSESQQTWNEPKPKKKRTGLIIGLIAAAMVVALVLFLVVIPRIQDADHGTNGLSEAVGGHMLVLPLGMENEEILESD